MSDLHIGALLFPQVTPLDLIGPLEVLGRLPGARVTLIAAQQGPVAAEHGVQLLPTATYDDPGPYDVLLVPGGPGQQALMEDEAALTFLRQQALRVSHVTSVCTGSLVLAAAGLLRGRCATTHWLSLPLLAALGAVPVAERVVVDGGYITAAGVSAGIDMALTLAAALGGEERARQIELLLEYDPHPPFGCGSPRIADAALVERVRAGRGELQAQRLAQVQRIAARGPV